MNPNASFERDLERWLAAEAAVSEPEGLHAAVIERAQTLRQRRSWTSAFPARWFGRNRGITLFAAAALLLVGGAMAAGSGLLRLPSAVPPQPAPTQTPAVLLRAASWTATGRMATPRAGHTATLLHDGRVFVTEEIGDGHRHPAELYDPSTGSWTAAGKSTFGEPWSVTLLDGRVLAGSVQFDPSTGLPDPGRWHTELYDPATGTWTTAGTTVTGHIDGPTVTLLLDGRVLLAGGSGAATNATAELFDPATGTWTVTGSMITPRFHHTATLLPDGKVLVAGGGDWVSATASAELYDPTTGTWTATGTMLAKYGSQVATRLADGKVLVTGRSFCASSSCRIVSLAELYDPATGTWTTTGGMSVAREHYTATLLLDGRVLAAGGIGVVCGCEADPFVASAELYDPASGTWTATASMAVARAGHTATLLLNGTVLVVGGEGGGTSSELYDPGSP